MSQPNQPRLAPPAPLCREGTTKRFRFFNMRDPKDVTHYLTLLSAALPSTPSTTSSTREAPKTTSANSPSDSAEN